MKNSPGGLRRCLDDAPRAAVVQGQREDLDSGPCNFGPVLGKLPRNRHVREEAGNPGLGP